MQEICELTVIIEFLIRINFKLMELESHKSFLNVVFLSMQISKKEKGALQIDRINSLQGLKSPKEGMILNISWI